MTLFAAIIAGLQAFGGAYQAEFTGHADEAAHFVSALMVRDYAGLWPRLAPAPAVALSALFWFPFTVYRQQPDGFRELAAQLRLPARMLVSSPLGWREGPWIATVAVSETRPQSTIARATKLLAETDWNGTRYKLKTSSGEEIERSLDETAVDIVVLDNIPAEKPEAAAHHPLLRGQLRESPSWRPSARARNLEAYCRVLPPRFPRQPPRIDLRSRIGYIVEER